MADENKNANDEAAQAAAAAAAAEADAAKAAQASDKLPAWLEPDYTGTLTSDQAQVRLEKHGVWQPPKAEGKPAKPAQTR
ncbi:MAG: hypothetical protein IJI03_12295 [Rudaea sp.]|nr:hypothetical protein [Rudaea sp.]